MLFEVILQSFNVQVRFAHQVSDDQVDALRVLLDLSNAVGNAPVLPDRVFDLAQFDAQAAYFYLIVFATQILEIAVRQPTGNVSGSVDSLTGVDGIVGELFVSQGRVIQVASGQTDPGNAQLSRLADRHRPAVAEDVKPDVVDGAPDGNGCEILVRRALEISDINRSLGGAIEVDQSDASLAAPDGIELFDMTRQERLSAGKHPSNRSEAVQHAHRLAFQIFQKHVQHGGNEVHDADVVFPDGFNNGRRIPFSARHQEAKFGALHGPPEKLPHRNIEGEGRLL